MNMMIRHPQTMLRARSGESLTESQMRQIAPSLFAPAPHESRSERYVYIPSTEIMAGLDRAGFQPVEVRQARSRDISRREHTKHMIRFTSRQLAERRVGDVSAEVTMVNAHDGSAGWHIMGGLFRLVCLNGMVCPEGVVQSYSVRHSGNSEKIISQVVEAANAVVENSHRALEAPRRWSGLELSRDEQMALAESARVARFGDSDGNVSSPITAQQMLIPRRPADQGRDLWRTFNVLQENAIRGGLTGTTRDERGRMKRSTTREVRSIDTDVKLNRALWMLAEKMAELKG